MKSFFASFWFNVIMSVVSVVALVDHIIDRKYIRIVIWLVLTYHFIKATYDGTQRRRLTNSKGQK